MKSQRVFFQSYCDIVTPSESALCKFQRSRQTRIETIQRCPPGTCVRVENEVITLHNSPRWDPQNRYIYISDSKSQEYRYTEQRSNHLENDRAPGYGQDANGAKSP